MIREVVYKYGIGKETFFPRDSLFTRFLFNNKQDYIGEMAEWLKAQHWNCYVGFLFTEGSNPSLSVSVNSPTLPTTMKFLVRGKSVDFRNREGSSPSIPSKKPILLLYYILLFFISGSKKIQYLSYSFYSFTNGPKVNYSQPISFSLHSQRKSSF